MKSSGAVHAGTVGVRRRKHRRHRPPKWLKTSSEIEATARSRTLMLLSVLSGETPVTDAIAQAKISRATYYHLETRALNAMLAAMNPLAGSAHSAVATDLSAAMARIAQLESQLKRLEQDRRRSQRLLLLTRKSLHTSVKTSLHGRRPRLLTSTMRATPKQAASPTMAPGASSR